MQVVAHAAEALEVGVHQALRLGGLDAELLGEPVGGQAVGEAVGHRLDLAAHLGVDGAAGDLEDLGGDGGVEVLAGGEGLDQCLVLGEVGHDPQLDLRVVGGEQRLVALADDEGPADHPALLGADRDVLQVRVLRGEPAGGGDHLVEGGVDPPGRGDRLEQALDGGAQLGLVAVAQQDHRQLVVGLGGEPGERVGVGGVPGLDLLGLGQRQLAEEDLLELLGRAEVELVAGGGVRLLDHALDLGGELRLQAGEPVAVGGDAGALHPGEQGGDRQLHVAQQPGGADLGEAGVEQRGEVEHGAGLEHQRLGAGGRVLLRGVEGELAGLGGRGRGERAGQVLLGEHLQGEGAAAGLLQVGGEGGVGDDALDAPAALGEGPHDLLGDVQGLGGGRVGQPGGEGALVLLGEQRRVEPRGRLPGGESDFGDLAGAERPAVDGGQRDRGLVGGVLAQPGGEGARVGEEFAVDLDAGGEFGGLGLDGGRVDAVDAVAEVGVAELQRLHERGDGRAVERRAGQVGHAQREFDVPDQLGQDAVALDRVEVLAQLLADLALDLVGPGDQLVEGAELVDPLGGGLLADAGDAGQVVGRVAAQGREVGVLAGGDAVLLGDLLRGVAGQLGDALGRVEHGDVLGDELERVPVAGDDVDVEAGRLGGGGQGGDDVVRLEALGGEPRHVHRVEQLADQPDLAAELVRGLGPVGLVVGELDRAEGLAGEVEGDREVGGRLVPDGVGEHRGEAVHRVGRLAGGGVEVLHGQRVERPVGHGVPVEQHQAGPGSGSATTRRALVRTLRSHVNVRSCRFHYRPPILGPATDKRGTPGAGAPRVRSRPGRHSGFLPPPPLPPSRTVVRSQAARRRDPRAAGAPP